MTRFHEKNNWDAIFQVVTGVLIPVPVVWNTKLCSFGIMVSKEGKLHKRFIGVIHLNLFLP
jgi:hypothetical protein